MKKIILITALSYSTYFVNAQPFKVTSAQTYLDSYWAKEGDINLEKAKSDIDEAVANEKTTSWGKAWYLKGVVYQSIFENKTLTAKFATVNILNDAFDAYKKAIDLNDVKFRDQENLYNYMKSICSYLNNRAVDEFQSGDFAKSYQDFIKLEEAFNFYTSNKQTFHLDISVIRSNAALCAQKAGLTKEAIKIYEAILAKGTSDATIYSTLVNLYKNDGRPDDAKKLIDDAVAKFPDNVNLLIAQLNYYLAENKHAEAIDKLNKAIQLDPKNDQLYVAAGLAYDKLKDVAKCREMYLKATDINPKNLNAWNNLGVTYVDEANDVIKQMNALGMSKEDQAKYDQLKIKRNAAFSAAKPYIQKALDLDSTNEQLKRVMKKIDDSVNN